THGLRVLPGTQRTAMQVLLPRAIAQRRAQPEMVRIRARPGDGQIEQGVDPCRLEVVRILGLRPPDVGGGLEDQRRGAERMLRRESFEVLSPGREGAGVDGVETGPDVGALRVLKDRQEKWKQSHLRASTTRRATSVRALAAGESGSATTMGRPASACCGSRACSGICPSSGT